MAPLKRIQGSTMVENLVAMTLVALAVGGFFQVMGLLKAQVNKTELKNEALLEISQLYNQYEVKVPKDDTLILRDTYELEMYIERQSEGSLRVEALARTLAGEHLLRRVRYYAKDGRE